MSENKNSQIYHCPACKNEEIIESDKSIHCPHCKLDFEKEFLGVIDDENILSQQELGGIIDAFDDEDKKKMLKDEFWE